MTAQVRKWQRDITDLQIAEGTGSPEGALSAKRKKFYMDTSAAAVETGLYIKRFDEISGDTRLGWGLVAGTNDKAGSVDITSNYIQTINDKVIYGDGTLTVTLLDPAKAIHVVRFRSLKDTMTLTASVGTTETTTITIGTGVTMGPRATGWFNLP